MDKLPQGNSIESFQEHPLGAIQHNVADIPVSVAEVSHLWSTYMAESMAETFLQYMVAKCEDHDYRNIMQLSLELSSHNLEMIRKILNSIKHPIPKAFGDQDVDVNVPRLYDETSGVRYIRMMQKFIIQNYALAFSESSRSDIRQFFAEAIKNSQDLIQRTDDVLLAKGVFPKTPYIIVPERVEFVDDKDYFGSFFGNGRPLNALEISNILAIMDFKVVVKAVKIGFAQVVKSEEIRNYFNHGAKIADKHINILRTILEKDGIPGPEKIDYRVTDSQESPFSDRLMLFHVTTIIAYILSAYGTGLSRIMRKDVVATYYKLMTEILSVAKDGADLLIKNGWLEKIPETANRPKLTH